VIAMFVRDEHGIEPLRVFTDHCQAPRNFFCTHACIDEYARIAGNDQDRVTSGATAENGKFHLATKRHENHR
jgi:hypothetical protein